MQNSMSLRNLWGLFLSLLLFLPTAALQAASAENADNVEDREGVESVESVESTESTESTAVWCSASGTFQLSFTPSIEPMPINQIHAWTLHLSDSEGQGLSGAEINVEGGMPAHDHGLPTAPRVTADLGDGDYQLEGLRFHMMGEWVLNFSILHDGRRESVSVIINL